MRIGRREIFKGGIASALAVLLGGKKTTEKPPPFTVVEPPEPTKFYQWSGTLSRRTVKLTTRLGPRDDLAWLEPGKAFERAILLPNDMIHFAKPGSGGVTITLRSRIENVLCDPAEPWFVRRHDDRHSQRITLKPGDEGVILGGWACMQDSSVSDAQDSSVSDQYVVPADWLEPPAIRGEIVIPKET